MLSTNFANIVTIREMIDHEVKVCRFIDNFIEAMVTKKPMVNKKRQGEVHVISYEK